LTSRYTPKGRRMKKVAEKSKSVAGKTGNEKVQWIAGEGEVTEGVKGLNSGHFPIPTLQKYTSVVRFPVKEGGNLANGSVSSGKKCAGTPDQGSSKDQGNKPSRRVRAHLVQRESRDTTTLSDGVRRLGASVDENCWGREVRGNSVGEAEGGPQGINRSYTL